MLEGLPETPEWTTWDMVTKAALPDQKALAGFKKLKELLLAYEAELRGKKSISKKKRSHPDTPGAPCASGG